MLSWLIGSTESLKKQLSSYVQANPLKQNEEVKNLTKEIWKESKPFFDFRGLVTQARESKIQKALLLARNERKIELLPQLTATVEDLRQLGKTPTEITAVLTSNKVYQFFTERELQLFSILHIDYKTKKDNPLPTPQTWNSWLKRVATDPLDLIHTISRVPLETVLQRTKTIVEAMETGNLETLTNEEKTAVVTVVLLEKFYGYATLLNPSLVPILKKIEESKGFKQLFEKLLAEKLLVSEEVIWTDLGAALQAEAKDSKINERGLLETLMDQKPAYGFGVVFHRENDAVSSYALDPSKDSDGFLRQLNWCKAKDTTFRLLLQKLLDPTAYAPPLSALRYALELAFPDAHAIIGGGALQSLQADVHEINENEYVINYSYQGSVTTKKKSPIKDNNFQRSYEFAYQLTKTAAGWQIQGPFKPDSKKE